MNEGQPQFSEEEVAEAEKFNAMVDNEEISSYELEGLEKGAKPEDIRKKAEIVNRQAESEEIKSMVEKRILSPEEAASFRYENEISASEDWVGKGPKLSRKLRKMVLSKFSPDDFGSEEIDRTPVHGTQIGVVRALWSGEGRRAMEYGYLTPEQIDPRQHPLLSERKGFWYFSGDFSLLAPDIDLSLGETRQFPVILVFQKFTKYDQPDSGQAPGGHYVNEKVPIRAIWLNQGKDIQTIDDQISAAEHFYNGKPIPQSVIFNHFEDRLSEVSDPKTRVQILEELRNWYDRREERVSDTLHLHEEKLSDWIGRLISNRQISKAKERVLKYYYFKMLKDMLTDDDKADIVRKEIKALKKIKKDHSGETVFAWGGYDRYDRAGMLTVQEAANYCANAMATGVDKSKIVPIYDREGHLLWPIEEDVKEDEQTVE